MLLTHILILSSALFSSSPDAGGVQHLKSTPLVLPGGPGNIGMDYLAYDPGTGRLWVPAGNTGQVDVIETATRQLQSIKGLPVVARGNRTVGPSSATVGDGIVYVGNRADSNVCAFDSRSLQRGACVQLDSLPDGIAYVSTTREIWVTAPRDKELIILDASGKALTVKSKIPLEGQPEGYAVDSGRGLFYTNLEDKDATLVLDVRSKKVTARFQPKCGEAGPRGIVLDEKSRQIFVACTDHVVSLSGLDGSLLAQAQTGAGVDNIDYLPSRRMLYVASGKTSTLSLFQVSDKGALQPVATAETAAGGRVVMVDSKGTAFVPDSAGGRLIVVESPK